ncbi:PTS glucitol/sorbitol transporter subunit IIA [Bacillus sp. A116_S68]|nr:PTS glucitol/sorbitol transporter subunit IIA [Bacillus sp. A116_S68]
MYKSNVIEMGSLVESFKEEMLVILFGPEAPKELREVSVIHECVQISENPVQEGGLLIIDNQEYSITAVGSSANQNLKELGHISIYFNEIEGDILPGAVFVSPSSMPIIKEGSTIIFK